MKFANFCLIQMKGELLALCQFRCGSMIHKSTQIVIGENSRRKQVRLGISWYLGISCAWIIPQVSLSFTSVGTCVVFIQSSEWLLSSLCYIKLWHSQTFVCIFYRVTVSGTSAHLVSCIPSFTPWQPWPVSWLTRMRLLSVCAVTNATVELDCCPSCESPTSLYAAAVLPALSSDEGMFMRRCIKVPFLSPSVELVRVDVFSPLIWQERQDRPGQSRTKGRCDVQ